MAHANLIWDAEQPGSLNPSIRRKWTLLSDFGRNVDALRKLRRLASSTPSRRLRSQTPIRKSRAVATMALQQLEAFQQQSPP